MGIIGGLLQIQYSTGGADSVFYMIIQVPVIFPADGKDTGDTDSPSQRQSAGQLQLIRANVVTHNDKPAVLQPDMDVDMQFLFSGILAAMQGIFQ